MNIKKYKVLIVDDTKHVIVLLKHYCSKSGFTTIEAYDGKTAIEMAKTEKPDVLLLDAMMPEMSGFEVCKILRENESTRFLPIIMVTALSEIEDRIKALNYGVDDFITKPADELLLITKIKTLIKSKIQREELEKIKFDFASMLIHDLKIPLSNIENYLTSLKSELVTESSIKNFNAITKDVEKIATKMNNFLSYLDIGSGKIVLNIAEVDVINVLEKVLSDCDILIQNRNLKIIKNYNAKVRKIFIDELRINQVFNNLLDEIIERAKDKSELEINILEEASNISINFICNKLFSNDNIEKIFFPISKLVEEGIKDSSIYSLVVSRMLIEAHDGNLVIENVDDKTKININLNIK